MSKSSARHPVSKNRVFDHPYKVISLVCILLYAQILSFGLVQFDDHGFVLMASDTLKLSNIPEFFRHSVFWVLGDTTQGTDVFYRPLQNVAYAVCNTIAPQQAWIYHFFGLGFHALAACLLFHLFRKLKFHSSVSFFFSLIYAVHPVLVQGVAWIAGIGDQMATVFCLLALNPGVKGGKVLLQMLFFFCALFSKEISVMLIPLFLFLFFKIEKNKVNKEFFVLITGWIILTVVYFLLRSNAVYSSKAGLISSAFESFRVNGILVLEYFEKIFIPYRLSPIPSREDAHFLTGGIVLLAFISLFIFSKRFTPMVLFGMLWFAAFLFPSFIQQNPQAHFFAFEHRLYLPLIGILIMLMELTGLKEIDLRSPVQKYGFTSILLAFSLLTIAHSRTFSDPYTFYDKALTSSPQSVIAYNGYGKLLLRDEKFAEAVDAFKKSYEYKSDDLQTTGKIAEIYLKNLKNPQEAIIWFKRTLDIDPGSIEAAVSIGDAYWSYIHDTTNAMVWYKKSLEISRGNEFAAASLGMIYVTKGQNEEARKYLLQSLASNPQNLVALKWMAISLFNDNKTADAVHYLNNAFQAAPSDVDVLRNLMICYYRLDDFTNTKKFSELVIQSKTPVPEEIMNYLKRKEKSAD